LSDGFADQFGGEKYKKFTLKRLKEALLQVHTLPIEEQKDALKRIFENWKGNTPQIDDICIIGIKIT